MIDHVTRRTNQLKKIHLWAADFKQYKVLDPESVKDCNFSLA